MEPQSIQNGTEMAHKTSEIDPKWSQEGTRTANNSKKEPLQHKKGEDLIRAPPFWPEKSPTWPQLGSQNGAKIVKKSMQKIIKKLMRFQIDFFSDYGWLSVEKWSQVGSKIDSKNDVSLEKRFFKQYL